MKKLHKAMLTGTLAAGLLIGGGIVAQHNQAFADEAGTTSTTANQPASNNSKHLASHHQFRGGFALGKSYLDAAAVLGIDQSTFKEELKQGKTIAQIAQEKAGLSEDAVLQKLTDAQTKKIDDALSAGKITQAQADKQKSGLADRLKKLVESKPKAMAFKGKQQAAKWGSPDKIASLLGITKEELAAERKAGKSIADIAAEKGISEDQLIAKLKDSLTDQLTKFVEHKGGPHAKKADSGTAPSATPAPTATP